MRLPPFQLEHFILELGERAHTEAIRLGDRDDTDPFRELSPCLVELVWISPTAAEALSDLTMLW
jgi:hypothetical protein